MTATQSKIDQFTSQHPAVTDWLIANQLTSDFAASLLLQVRSKGQLSERQIAAVETNISRKQHRDVLTQEVDVSKLEEVFSVAKDRGVKQPMLRLGDFKFKVASAFSANAGAIYVTAQDEFKTYVGKIMNGRFVPARDCTPGQAQDVCELAANPADSAKAYGQRTGNCCVCGRELTAGESIDRMIGPICAEKYGF